MHGETTIVGARKGLERGERSSRDLVEACIDAIERWNGEINAVVTRTDDRARTEADSADARRSEGDESRPLEGIPITVKDHLAVAGVRNTNGMPHMKGYVPDFDATVVRRLREAGAIVLGKCNLPFMAMDFQARSPVFGVTNNPWDAARTSGGSSAGAAAVASYMSYMEIGSDLGGSLRIPAHFCGVYSIRPTDSAVSRHGLHPGGPASAYRSTRHMAVPGPIARSLADLALAVEVIAGPDDREPDLGYLLPPHTTPGKLRFAWSDSWPGLEVTDGYRDRIHRFVARCEAAGIELTKIDEPPVDLIEAYRTFGALLSTEIMRLPLPLRIPAALSRGRATRDFPVHNPQIRVGRRNHDRWVMRRDRLMHEFERFLTPFDGYICPVTTAPAPLHLAPPRGRNMGVHDLYAEVAIHERRELYGRAFAGYTLPFSVTGSPVVSLPIGLTEGGLPVGVQVVGRRFHDLSLLAACTAIEERIQSSMPVAERYVEPFKGRLLQPNRSRP